jgi:aminoglycoside phosphotransferase (APT) family kinase protein
LDGKLATPDRDRLKAVLRDWHTWAVPLRVAPEPVRILPGESNVNVLVRAPGPGEDIELVVRLDREATLLGVDRAVEGLVLDRVRGEPWAPTVVHREPGRCLVTRYVPGPILSGPDAPEAAGALLARIHALPPTALPVLDPAAHAQGYLASLPEDVRPLAEGGVRALGHALRDAGPATPVLAHVDFQAANVIATAGGPVVLDWEYARAAEPAWDLAVFAAVASLGTAAVDRLGAAYEAAGGRVDRARLPLLMDAYGLIELLWWALRRPVRTDTRAFAAGCEGFRERLEAHAAGA